MRYSVVALVLVTASLARAGAIPNGDFEKGLAGWQVVKEGAAQATASGDRPADGKSVLLLQCTGADRAWALGPALPGAPGDVLQLTFSARHAGGQAKLLLNLVSDPAALSDLPVWEAVLPLDGQWHKLALLVRTPPARGGGTPRLAFGVAGVAGAWAIDDVDAQPGKPPELPALQAAQLSGETPQTEALPDDWRPEGFLDARTKEIAGKPELILNVNGIEVGMEPTFSCRRGHRAGMMMFAVNRGQVEKELRISGAAPVGVEAPAWTVPIRPQGTTTFHMAVQSLRLGEFWLKLTVVSARDTASAPIKLTCTRCYPDVGTMWHGTVDAAILPQFRPLGVDLHVLAAPSDPTALQPMCEAVAARGGEAMAAPLLSSLTPLQYPAAVTRLFDVLQPSFWCAAPDDASLATLAVLPRLIMDLRKRRPDSGFISPPVLLGRDWQKGRLVPTAATQITAEKMAGLVAVAVQPPRLGPPCVLREEVDGKADAVSGALCGLTRHTDLGYLREFLTQRRVELPMLVGTLGAAPSGDERLAALYLARAMTQALSQGATAVLFEPQATSTNGWGLVPTQAQRSPTPVQQVVRFLGGELAGASPLVPLADSPGVSADPEALVTYKPFLRGGEGIVVLWNNTGVPKDVTVEFRSEPVVAHRLLFSYQGDFAVQRWDPIMQFSEEAFKRKQPAIYVRLDPLQVQVHSFRLLQPHWTWLRKVELTIPLKPADTINIPGREERPWWRDMLGGRGQGAR